MFKTVAVTLTSAALLSGCGPTLVEFGGVRAPYDPPARTVTCDLRDWEQVSEGTFAIPGELIAFWRASGNRLDVRELELSYDILPSGQVRNIVFEDPQRYTGHGAVRHAIKNAADTIEARQYEWLGSGSAPYATGCRTVFDITLERVRG